MKRDRYQILTLMKKKSRLHKDILKNLDDYFLWGDDDLKNNKSFLKCIRKNLYTFGHPKFDL